MKDSRLPHELTLENELRNIYEDKCPMLIKDSNLCYIRQVTCALNPEQRKQCVYNSRGTGGYLK